MSRRSLRAGPLAAVSLLTLAASALPATARDPVHAFVGAHVIPIGADEIPDGVLLVQGQRIKAVGPSSRVRVPRNAVVHDVSGQVLMPGLVDTHSHVGGGWGGDSSVPIQPDVRLIDSINCRHPGFQRAQAGGVTAANVMSGSGHLMSGQTAYIKHRDVNTIEEMVIRDDDGWAMGGMKMANGTNSIRKPPFPGTRAKSAALVRQAFHDALAYRAKKEKAGRDTSKLPARDLGKEALLEVLDGKRVVHHHTHRHDDIVTVLRLKRRSSASASCCTTSARRGRSRTRSPRPARRARSSSIDSPGGKLEAIDVAFKTGLAFWSSAGVLRSRSTPTTGSPTRACSCAWARSASAPGCRARRRPGRADARTAPEMMDMGDRTRLARAPARTRTSSILDGDPLSASTRRSCETWVEGEKRLRPRPTRTDRLCTPRAATAPGHDQDPSFTLLRAARTREDRTPMRAPHASTRAAARPPRSRPSRRRPRSAGNLVVSR